VRFIFLLLCSLGWNITFANPDIQGPVIKLDQPHYNLKGLIEYYEDYSKSLSASDIIQLPGSAWILARGAGVNSGHIDAIVWIRLRIDPASNTYSTPTPDSPTPDKHTPDNHATATNSTWQLLVNYPVLSDVRLYVQNPLQQWLEVKPGGDEPVDFQQEPNRAHLFNLPLDQPSETTFLLRINEQSGPLVPLILLPKHAMQDWEHYRTVFLSLYYGAISIMAIFFLILAIGVKSKRYFIYVCFLLSSLLFAFSSDGFLKEAIYSGTYKLSSTTYILCFLTAFFSLWLTSSVLELKSRLPILYKIFIAMSVVVACCASITPFLHPLFALKLLTLVGLTALSLTVLATLHSLLTGHKEARFFIVGWTCYSIFSSSAVLTVLGIYPLTPISVYFFHCGNFLETIFFSITLVDQMNLRRKAQIRAEQELKEQLQRANDELQATNEQLTYSNSAKDRFISTISHELRTPVHGIYGGLSLIDTVELPAEVREYMQTVHTSANAMSRLVDDLINYTDLINSNLGLQNTTFSLQDLQQYTLEKFTPKAAARGLQLEFTLNGTRNFTLIGDEEKIRILVFQLTDNAIKCTEQGSVTVSATTSTSNELVLTVTDTGPGMNPALIDELCKPFEQADSSFTRKVSGIGIGLSLCRKIVECMQGSMDIESCPDQGTRIRITIPLALAAADETESGQQSGQCTIQHSRQEQPLPKSFDNRFHALIVEDNPVSQQVLMAMLKKLAVNTTLAINGKEGSDLCHAQRFDIVFMDCQMPVMDGLQATRSIRESATPNSGTPIVAVTANATDRDRQRCQEAGMNGFLKKPVQLEDIRQLLTQLLAVR